jgi:hypothetical protein
LASLYTISRPIEDELRNLDVDIVAEAYPGRGRGGKLTQLVMNALG